jgi:predicted dehydrogenase
MVSMLRVGFIGAGYVANRHLDNLLAFRDVDVVGVADPQSERATAFAAKAEARPYERFDQLIENEGPDALYIGVPPYAHGEPEQAAIENDLPFFVEKPLSVNFEVACLVAKTRSCGFSVAQIDTSGAQSGARSFSM